MSDRNASKFAHLSLLPDSASFEELVQECFLAFKGFGLMLSPLDAELVAGWGERRIPFEVVARGIARGVEKALWHASASGKSTFSLRSCRAQIDSEIRKYADRSTGRPGLSDGPAAETLEAARSRKLLKSLKKLGRTPAWARAVEKIRAKIAEQSPRNLAECERQEQSVYLSLLRGLPFRDRVELLRAAKRAYIGDASAGRRARKRARRFHCAALVRGKLGIREFW